MVKKDFLERVLGLENVKESSDNWLASCPFAYLHPDGDDKRASFAIHKETGVWHCFTCGKKGNLTTLVMELLGVDSKTAYNMCNEEGLLERLRKKLTTLKAESNRNFFEMSEQEICLSPLSFQARKYLEGRGISLKTVEHFNIGFCESGVYRDRIIIPVIFEGREVGFVARDITGKAERKYLFPRGFKKSYYLFNIDSISGDEVWLVEGVFDVMKLWELGLKNVVAVFGSEVSDNQVSLLLKKKVRKVILLFDKDAAGIKAENTFLQRYFRFFELFKATLPEGVTDPGEITCKRSVRYLLLHVAPISSISGT